LTKVIVLYSYIVTMLSKYGLGIWDTRETYPGSRGKRHRIPDPDPQQWPPDPQQWPFFTPGFGIQILDPEWKKSISETQDINISDHVSESLVTIYWVNSVLRIRIRNCERIKPGSATLPPTCHIFKQRQFDSNRDKEKAK
jgi:hypothetical protein